MLKKNLSRLEEKNYSVTALDYAVCAARAGSFDLVFIDPPYASDAGISALKAINLNTDGVAVYERDRPFSGEVDGLELYDERKYGRIYLSFFRKKEGI